MTELPLILLGAGGHARVLLSLARASGSLVVGVCDPELASTGVTDWRGLKVLGDDLFLGTVDCGSVQLVNGIGHLAKGSARQALHEKLKVEGFQFATLVHPSACVDESARLGEGAQVMAGAIIQADSVLGADCIVNTGASVDHDCMIGDHVHIAPGAIVCGSVTIGVGAFIGAGATIIQNCAIGNGAIVAAGSVVVKDVAAGHTLICRQVIR